MFVSKLEIVEKKSDEQNMFRKIIFLDPREYEICIFAFKIYKHTLSVDIRRKYV